MNQGWYECNNNEMHFCSCQFNILRITNKLSNYSDLIAGERNGIMFNPLVEPCVCKGILKDFSMEDEKNRGKAQKGWCTSL